MSLFSLHRSLILCLALGFLAACDSAEERAEGHYQNSLELLESGDVERALVELRNVLSLNEFHVEGRRLFAETVRARGDFSAAYSNFLRLSEENPDDLPTRLALSEMAIEAQNWEEAERHSAVLLNANAQLDGADVVDIVLQYRQAALAEDQQAIDEILSRAIALNEARPNDSTLLRTIIDILLRRNDTDRAMSFIDQAIAAEPTAPVYYQLKSSILAQNEDFAGLEDHMRATVEAFPDDVETKGLLVRLLTSMGQPERAEAFLREQIATSEDSLDLQVALIGYLRQIRGGEAALAEIDAALDDFDNAPALLALKAGLLFDGGDREAGIAQMQSVVDSASEDNDDLSGYKISLARMLIAENNEVGARQLVEDVLAVDSTHVEALKLSAGWQIDGDQIDEAINTLRRALDQAPQDVEVMTLLARAHQRAGEPELSQDMLSLAAEASGYAPRETIRFANTLISDGNLRPAEDVLVLALRQSPGDYDLLRTLGRVYVLSEDWPRGQQVESTLRRDGSFAALRLADSLRLQILSRRDGRDQALAELEGMAANADANLGTKIALLRERLRAGEEQLALDIANEIVASEPDNPRLAMVLGGTQFALRDFEAAEKTYKQITEAAPTFERAWIQLLRTQSSKGEIEESRATLEAALQANENAPNLLWAQATFLERSNDIDGAISIYETLYEQNSDSPIVANNLASLLATHRADEASLDRAFAIARRLRGTSIPPFQDTYGWILHRRGEAEEALTYLEPAANALANDAIVQFHLASVYEALGQNDEALVSFQRAVELAGENDPRPQIGLAKEAIERIASEADNQ